MVNEHPGKQAAQTVIGKQAQITATPEAPWAGEEAKQPLAHWCEHGPAATLEGAGQLLLNLNMASRYSQQLSSRAFRPKK
jgi:hypothetical protein